jgi:hypothetical protein
VRILGSTAGTVGRSSLDETRSLGVILTLISLCSVSKGWELYITTVNDVEVIDDEVCAGQIHCAKHYRAESVLCFK